MRKFGELGAGLLHRDVRQLIVETTLRLEEACGWRLVPPKPPTIAHLTTSAIEELRASDDINNTRLLRAWNESTIARSSAIADNISRMRSALHLLRFWRRLQRAQPDDREACDAVLKVWAFCRDHWGIVTPPTDPRKWDKYCEEHVLTLAKRKEQRS